MTSQPVSRQALTSAAISLRKLSHGHHSRFAVVRRCVDGRMLALIDAAGRRVHTMRRLEHLVEDLASGKGEIGEHDASGKQPPRPGVRFSDESFLRLCWLVGARLGRDIGLAPWLDATTGYRLLSWPDFGEIGDDPQAVSLFQVIAKRELGIAAMVDVVQLPHRTVCQLVNSLSLCGLLASGPVPRGRASGVPRPSSGTKKRKIGWFGRLLRRLFPHSYGR
jgi:hypothetical protein